MNDDQRRGLQELADWVASLKVNGTSEGVAEAYAGSSETEPTVNGDRPDTGDLSQVSITGEFGSSTGDAMSVASEDAAVVVEDPPSGGGDDRHDAEEADDSDERPPAEGKRRSSARTIIDWVLVVAIALFVALVIRTFVLAHFVVDGTSMASTLDNGDRVFVNKMSYRIGDPGRGDVVVLHQNGGTRDLIKRVIGLPGETISHRDCQVFIDGRLLEEPYLDTDFVGPGNCGRDIEGVTVPDDHVFVMGDNRGGSQDSRNIGPIHEDELVGRAFVVFWPPGNWKWL